MKRVYLLLICAMSAAGLFARANDWMTINVSPGKLLNIAYEHPEIFERNKNISLVGTLEPNELDALAWGYNIEVLDLSRLTNSIIGMTLVLDGEDMPSDIKNIILGNNVIELSNFAFINIGIDNIYIPKSLKTIGCYPFTYTNLKNVFIDDLAAWCDIDMYEYSSCPLHKGAVLYLHNKSVDSLVIPDNVIRLKPYAFCGGRFNSVTIPNSVKEVDCTAFGMESSNIDYITNDVKNIKSPIKNIYVYAVEPPQLDGYLEGIDLDNVVLHVPAESLAKYQKAVGWAWFRHIKPMGIVPTEIDEKTLNNAFSTFF